jgi:hypothetical protein
MEALIIPKAFALAQSGWLALAFLALYLMPALSAEAMEDSPSGRRDVSNLESKNNEAIAPACGTHPSRLNLTVVTEMGAVPGG